MCVCVCMCVLFACTHNVEGDWIYKRVCCLCVYTCVCVCVCVHTLVHPIPVHSMIENKELNLLLLLPLLLTGWRQTTSCSWILCMASSL